jgi:hypothetical protein
LHLPSRNEDTTSGSIISVDYFLMSRLLLFCSVIDCHHFVFPPVFIYRKLYSSSYRVGLFYHQDDWFLLKLIAHPSWSSLEKIENIRRKILYMVSTKQIIMQIVRCLISVLSFNLVSSMITIHPSFLWGLNFYLETIYLPKRPYSLSFVNGFLIYKLREAKFYYSLYILFSSVTVIWHSFQGISKQCSIIIPIIDNWFGDARNSSWSSH